MLKTLSVRNYALITDVKVEFDSGLSTITGETGAGKSILMGALSLILGNRADSGVLKNKEEKCVIEAVFQVDIGQYSGWLKENDLDVDERIIMRREIVPSGKSRAFINDTPVTLPVMKELGDRLVNIHAQHENLMLNQDNFPVLALDAYLGLDQERNEYLVNYQAYQALKSEYQRAKSLYQEEQKNRDYIEFQLNQLIEARLDDDVMTELETEREILEHAEEIQNQLGQVLFLFEDSEQSVIPAIKQALQSIRSVSGYLPALEESLQRLDSSYIELKDILAEINQLNAKVESDPARLELVSDRLDLLYSLEQKHQVNGQDELIRLRTELEQQLGKLDLSAGHLDEMERQISQEYQSLMQSGESLSAKRQAGNGSFCEKTESMLKDLGMPNAKFRIGHQVNKEPAADGLDAMEFLFAANKNQQPESVTKVASGGEVSRLMLSIKALISASLSVPTLIFDEIDSGVSGEIADKMGQLIRRIAKGRQVLNITHLPQVARSGEFHYLVYKYDDEQTTHTAIKKLNFEERVTQLARMLSGEKLTDEAISNARQLLN